MSDPIRIGSTQMQVLAILDKGPSYAAAMIEANPDIVAGSKKFKNGVVIIDAGSLYVKLKRLEKRELIERIENFKLPRGEEFSRQVRSRAVWYRLTPEGRELLQQHRRAIRK